MCGEESLTVSSFSICKGKHRSIHHRDSGDRAVPRRAGRRGFEQLLQAANTAERAQTPPAPVTGTCWEWRWGGIKTRDENKPW